jgi:AcrR family transcriptional regulator
MTGPVPRVRRPEVRRRLLEAAAQMFAQRGYAATRLEEIANAAGFTKGAVYSNFSGKPAILAELIEQYVRGQFAARTTEIRGHRRPARVLADVAEAYARDIVTDDSWTRLLVEIAQQAARDEEVRAIYLGVRRSLREELAGRFSAAAEMLDIELAIPPERLALTIQALRLGLALEHGTDPTGVDRRTIEAVVADTLRGAIRDRAPIVAGGAATSPD